MKKHILLCLTLLGFLTLNAQDDYWNQKKLLPNEDFFEKAELVIEGKILKTFGSYDAKGNYNPNDIYTVQAILVQWVYKGNAKLTNDTVYVVRHFGEIYREITPNKFDIITMPEIWEDDMSTVDPGIYLDGNNSDILFFVKSDFPENPIKSEYSGHLQYRFLQDKVKAIVKIREKISGLNNLIFNNREELYNYMKQFKGYSIPDIAPKQLQDLPTKSVMDYKDAGVDSLQYEKVKSLWGIDKKKTPSNDSKSSDFNTLSLALANQQVVYDSLLRKYYLKFDMLESSNNPNIYFDGVYVNIGYNPALCGTNVVDAGKVLLSFGNKFNNADDYFLYTFYDKYANGIHITFGVNITHQNRVLLDSTPTPVLHFQIELLPHLDSIPSQLVFLDTLFTANISTYTLTSNTPFGYASYEYDKTFYSNSDIIYVSTTATPVITTDLSTLSKTAGIGDTLTIRGYNFGNNRGSVLFKNANDGGATFLKGLDEQYYITWSDTLIKVLVPSLVYKGYEEDTIVRRGGAGTGPIKIKTTSGDSCISSTSLYIPTSVLNTRLQNGSSIHRIYLARENCDYDFQFTLHRHYQYDTEKIAVIDSALHHWSALTGLTMTLEQDASGNLVFVDTTIIANKNIIYPYTNATASIMTTRSSYKGIIMNGDTIFYRTTGSNIGIKDSPSASSWNYDFSGTVPTGEISFYHAFMHELGHILLLGHVIAPSQLMHYATGTGIPIMTLDASDTSVIAANQNIEASQTINWSTASGLKKIKVPAKPFITTTPINALSCNGTPVTLTASNISPSNMLQWKNNGSAVGSTNPLLTTEAGNYSLTVSNGIDNCSFTSDTVEVKSGVLTADFDVTYPYQNACGELVKGSINITVSDSSTHPPFTFNWNTGDTTEDLSNLSSGLYSVTISNAIGCNLNYSKLFKIRWVPIQTIQIQLRYNKECAVYAHVSGGTPPYTYEWLKTCYISSRPGIISTIISTSDTAALTYCSSGTTEITLTVTDANGCSTTITVPNCKEGFKNPQYLFTQDFPASQPNIYPNPTSGKFQISGIQLAEIQVFNINGVLLHSQKDITENSEIDLENLPNGIYLINIIEEQNTTNLRIVIEK